MLENWGEKGPSNSQKTQKELVGKDGWGKRDGAKIWGGPKNKRDTLRAYREKVSLGKTGHIKGNRKEDESWLDRKISQGFRYS